MKRKTSQKLMIMIILCKRNLNNLRLLLCLKLVGMKQYISEVKYKVGDLSWGWPKNSLFNSYYTVV